MNIVVFFFGVSSKDRPIDLLRLREVRFRSLGGCIFPFDFGFLAMQLQPVILVVVNPAARLSLQMHYTGLSNES
jgi:hypothetical protein